MATNSAADKVNMFEDLMIGLQNILKRLEMPGGFDDTGSEKNLVAKNIVPSDVSTFNKFPAVKSVLNSEEKNRAYNIGVQWARAFFDVQKLNKASEDISKPSTVLSKAKETVKVGKQLPEKTPENKSSMLGLVAGVAGVLAAAYALWETFGAEGGFVMKAVSKLPSFLKLLKGTAGEIGASLLKRIKFIPFIGALAGFVFAFMRFQEGQWFKGTLEIVSAIASLTGIGLPLSYIIDGALILHDLSEEKGDETGMTAAAVKGGKYTTKAIIGILKKTTTTVGTKLLKVLKFVPFIGGVAGLALSYMRFQEGEWVAGIFEFVSAILDFIPGVGNLASYIIDGGLLLYDILKTPTVESAEKPKQGSGYSFNFSNGMNYLKKLIGPSLTKAIPYIPVIGNFIAIYTGITSIMSGNVGEGVRKLIQGMFIFLPPGLSDQIITGFEWLMSMFTDETIQPPISKPQAPKPFIAIVKDYIKSKLQKLPSILREPLKWLGILDDTSSTEPTTVPATQESKRARAIVAQASQEPKQERSLANTSVEQVKSTTVKPASASQSEASDTSVIDQLKSITKAAATAVANTTKSIANSPILKLATDMIKSATAVVGTTTSKIVESAAAKVKPLTMQSEPKQQSNAGSAISSSSIVKAATAKVQPYAIQPEAKKQLDVVDKPNTNKTLEMQRVFNDIKAGDNNIKQQTSAILAQNSILQEIAYVARQQLEVAKKKSAVVVNNMQGSPSSNVNFSSDSFNTGTQSSRELYSSSPYTLFNA